jgi:hypothetical protein
MKYFKFFLFSVLVTIAMSACGGSAEQSQDGAATEQTDAAGHEGHDHSSDAAAPHGEGAAYTSAYVCPMHCEGSGAAEAGKCPKCGMDYVAQADHVKDGHKH